MKKFFVFFLVLFLSCLLLVGCGDNNHVKNTTTNEESTTNSTTENNSTTSEEDKKYNVVFAFDEGVEGTLPEAYQLKSGSSLIFPEVKFTYKDHFFSSFVIDGTSYSPLTEITMPDHDVTIRVRWLTKEDMVTVSFQNEDGETILKDVLIEKNKGIPESIPTLDGYTFTGWYYDDLHSNAYKSSDTFTKNTILYAEFIEVVKMSETPLFIDQAKVNSVFELQTNIDLINENYKEYFNILDDGGNILSAKINQVGDDAFEVSPENGYIEGGAYSFNLLSNALKFKSFDQNPVYFENETYKNVTFHVELTEELEALEKQNAYFYISTNEVFNYSFKEAGVTKAISLATSDIGKDLYEFSVIASEKTFSPGEIISMGESETEGTDFNYFKILSVVKNSMINSDGNVVDCYTLQVVSPNISDIYDVFNYSYKTDVDLSEYSLKGDKELANDFVNTQSFNKMALKLAYGITTTESFKKALSTVPASEQDKYSLLGIANAIKNLRVYAHPEQVNASAYRISVTIGGEIPIGDKCKLNIQFSFVYYVSLSTFCIVKIQSGTDYVNSGVRSYNAFTYNLSSTITFADNTTEDIGGDLKDAIEYGKDAVSGIINGLENEPLLNEELEYVDLVKVPICKIPIPVGDLIALDITITFKIKLAVSAGFSFSGSYGVEKVEGVTNVLKDENGKEIGLSKDLHSYDMTLFEGNHFEITVKGGVGLKVGVDIALHLSILHLDNLGLQFGVEIGVYGELFGYCQYTSYNNQLNGAIYFELGLYVELHADYDFLIFEGSFKLAEFRVPFLSLGNRAIPFSYLTDDAIVMNQKTWDISLNNCLKVNTFDVLDCKTSTKTFANNQYSYRVVEGSEFFSIDENGMISVITDEKRCSGVIRVCLKGQKAMFGDRSLYKLVKVEYIANEYSVDDIYSKVTAQFYAVKTSDDYTDMTYEDQYVLVKTITVYKYQTPIYVRAYNDVDYFPNHWINYENMWNTKFDGTGDGLGDLTEDTKYYLQYSLMEFGVSFYTDKIDENDDFCGNSLGCTVFMPYGVKIGDYLTAHPEMKKKILASIYSTDIYQFVGFAEEDLNKQVINGFNKVNPVYKVHKSTVHMVGDKIEFMKLNEGEKPVFPFEVGMVRGNKYVLGYSLSIFSIYEDLPVEDLFVTEPVAVEYGKLYRYCVEYGIYSESYVSIVDRYNPENGLVMGKKYINGEKVTYDDFQEAIETYLQNNKYYDSTLDALIYKKNDSASYKVTFTSVIQKLTEGIDINPGSKSNIILYTDCEVQNHDVTLTFDASKAMVKFPDSNKYELFEEMDFAGGTDNGIKSFTRKNEYSLLSSEYALNLKTSEYTFKLEYWLGIDADGNEYKYAPLQYIFFTNNMTLIPYLTCIPTDYLISVSYAQVDGYYLHGIYGDSLLDILTKANIKGTMTNNETYTYAIKGFQILDEKTSTFVDITSSYLLGQDYQETKSSRIYTQMIYDKQEKLYEINIDFNGGTIDDKTSVTVKMPYVFSTSELESKLDQEFGIPEKTSDETGSYSYLGLNWIKDAQYSSYGDSKFFNTKQFYAIYEKTPSTFTLTLNVGSPEGCSSATINGETSLSYTQNYDEYYFYYVKPVVKTNDIENPLYHLDYWIDEEENKFDFRTNITISIKKDTTLTAHFKLEQNGKIDKFFFSGDHGSINGSSFLSKPYGSTLDINDIPVPVIINDEYNYKFVGWTDWFDEDEAIIEVDLEFKTNQYYKAIYEIDNLADYHCNFYSFVSIEEGTYPSIGKFDQGTKDESDTYSVVIPNQGEYTVTKAPTMKGYTFLHYLDSSKNVINLNGTISVSKNESFYAVYEKNSTTVEITFNAGSGSFADGTKKKTSTIEIGEKISFAEKPITTVEGYIFASWGGATYASTDITVYAIYGKEISNETEFLAIEKGMDETYVLTSSIYVKLLFPIGYQNNENFTGSIYGNGHGISYLLRNPISNVDALFANFDGLIDNTYVLSSIEDYGSNNEEEDLANKKTIGMLAGVLGSDAIVESCKFKSSWKLYFASEEVTMGNIAAINYGKISNIYVEEAFNTISSRSKNLLFGGIVGINYGEINVAYVDSGMTQINYYLSDSENKLGALSVLNYGKITNTYFYQEYTQVIDDVFSMTEQTKFYLSEDCYENKGELGNNLIRGLYQHLETTIKDENGKTQVEVVYVLDEGCYQIYTPSGTFIERYLYDSSLFGFETYMSYVMNDQADEKLQKALGLVLKAINPINAISFGNTDYSYIFHTCFKANSSIWKVEVKLYDYSNKIHSTYLITFGDFDNTRLLGESMPR